MVYVDKLHIVVKYSYIMVNFLCWW